MLLKQTHRHTHTCSDSDTHKRIDTNEHSIQTLTHTHRSCSCNLMAWTTATSEIQSSFPLPVIQIHVQPRDGVCVCMCAGECVNVFLDGCAQLQLQRDWRTSNHSLIPLPGINNVCVWGGCRFTTLSITLTWYRIIYRTLLHHLYLKHTCTHFGRFFFSKTFPCQHLIHHFYSFGHFCQQSRATKTWEDNRTWEIFWTVWKYVEHH